MGCNSTFKKRRHSYKGALGLELKVRGIVTNYVVYHFQLASNLSGNASHARRGSIPSKILKFSTRVYIQLYHHVHGTAGTKSTQILNLVYSYTKSAAAASCDACARTARAYSR